MPANKDIKGLRLILLVISFFFLYVYAPAKSDEGKKHIIFSFPKKKAAKKVAKGNDFQRKIVADDLSQHLATRYAMIRYETLKDLKKFNRRIDYSPGGFSLKSLFSPSGSKNIIDSIKKKVDALYRRVQEILDMRGRMTKVNINLYRKKSFDDLYYRLLGTKRRVRSWYLFESKTIFINIEDVNEGILAHEMAHHIVDHYLKVRPPKATAEILARYVDKHLIF